MFSWIRNWGPKKLAAAWSVYWIALATTTLWSPVKWALHLSTLPDNHASASFGINNGLANLTMMEDGRNVYNHSVELSTVLFWIAVPPLLLFLLWVIKRPSRESMPTVHPQSATGSVASNNEQLRQIAERLDANPYDASNSLPPRNAEPVARDVKKQ